MIDAHMHFWEPSRGDYGWLNANDLPTLFRPYGPDDIADTLATLGVDGVVAVQAAPTEDETRYLFALARRYPLIKGVVGWVDMAAPDAPARIVALVKDGGGLLKSIRPMLQDIAEVAWVARPELDAAFDALITHDLAFDALVKVPHLPALKERLARSPGLRVIIDHGAKPDIAGDGMAAWTDAMAPFAAMPDVFCKLSGLLTEAGDKDAAAVDPYAHWLIDNFGASRLVFGSDWPVLTLASNYTSWFDQAKRLIDDPAVFGLNAQRFYKLERTTSILTLSASDNVGVALRAIAAGEDIAPGIAAAEPIGFGFKVALAAIPSGAKVTKYGVSIGSASTNISAGDMVHMHNMQSDYTATHTRELKGV